MHNHSCRWQTSICIAVVSLLAAMPAIAGVRDDQSSATPLTSAAAEAIHEHMEEAEDLVESLLDWRHVLTTVNTGRDDRDTPTEPATTLIAVRRHEVQELARLLDATSAMLPAAPHAASAPRGDLRAHADKARAIVRELMPAGTAPVGTTGATSDTSDLITVDRTALQRLEIELDAMELLAPRRLHR
jgi:hypothetical protein